MDELIEKLADLEHEQWAHWTRYMLDHMSFENTKRWRGQCETSYADLSEKEKESDREWARRVMGIVRGYMSDQLLVAEFNGAA